jgi:G3E family GTPase
VIPTTLVTGPSATARETAIAAVLNPDTATSLILEGLPDGSNQLDVLPDHHPVFIARIAPGCLCCTGNLTMRVTLNRILRRPPARLFISLATATHIGQLRAFLTAPPYDRLLALTDDLSA